MVIFDIIASRLKRVEASPLRIARMEVSRKRLWYSIDRLTTWCYEEPE